MKPTWRRGSPVRTRVRSSPIRDPGAKDFQKFGRECTKNEKEPKKQKQRPVENDRLWKSTKTWIPTALEKPAALPHLHTGPATNYKIMERFNQELWTSGGLN